MKLNEIAPVGNFPNFPIFAWIESSRGPEDIEGVRLAYIEPRKARHEHNLASATAANDERWIANVKRMADQDKQKFATPDFGWWDNKDALLSGRPGFMGTTIDMIKGRHPDMKIFSTREEAIKAAEAQGLI